MTSEFPGNTLSAKDADLLNSFSLQLKIDALKAHINMHFLFNSLYTLSTLIDEDQEMSKSFLQKSSDVYQYLLCDHEHKIVPLSVEMDCIANYFFLYKIRFGTNINLNIQLPKTIRRLGIAPLTIITLIENAIKHNEISERDPLSISIFTHDGKVTEECMNNKKQSVLCIRIRIENQFIVIENNLNPRVEAVTGRQTGLQHLRLLYLELTSILAVIEKTKNSFRVKVPLFVYKNL